MTIYLPVVKNEGDIPVDLPLNEDGTLSFSVLHDIFPGVTTLRYLNQKTGTFRLVFPQNGFLYPVDGVWPQALYIAVIPADKSVIIPKSSLSGALWLKEFVKFFDEIRFNNDGIRAHDDEKILLTANSLKTLKNSFWFGHTNFGTELFVRKCYIDLAYLIMETFDAKECNHGIALVGTPGIGKSQFLSYLLWFIYVKRKDIETIIINSIAHCMMLVVKRNGEVKSIEESDFNTINVAKTICLYDPANKRDPDRVPTYFPLFMVAACSPSTNKEAFIDQGNRKTVKQLFMPVWSEEELNETGEKSVYYWRPDYFDNLFDCIGGMARYTLKIAQRPATLKTDADSDPETKLAADTVIREDYENMLQVINMEIDKHKVTAAGGIKLAKDLGSPRPEDAARHMLEHFDVNVTDEDKKYKNYKPKIATKYVATALFKRFEGEEFKDRIRLMMSSDDSTRRGHVFETYVHFMFKSQITLPTCKYTYDELAKKLAATEFGTETFNCSQVVKFFGSSLQGRDGRLKPELVGAPDGAYCMPRYKNFKSIDSVIWPDKMLQITVSDSHNMDTGFLAKQAEILKTYKNVPKPILYFVTPLDVFHKFEVKAELRGIFSEIYTVGIDLSDERVIQAMFLGRPSRKDGQKVGFIQLDDLKAAMSTIVSINQMASTSAAVAKHSPTSVTRGAKNKVLGSTPKGKMSNKRSVRTSKGRRCKSEGDVKGEEETEAAGEQVVVKKKRLRK